jgi:ubiquinol-cytochrome c reductase cytochrome b subunit
MHYISDELFAFSSVEHIMRDVNYGWMFRYAHANGASMSSIVVYVHIFRGLYYGSYIRPRVMLWLIGVVISPVMIVTAFMGYVLPWGQMSSWGATVITNSFSAVPFAGASIVTWLWGGYSVGAPTLSRFFALHFPSPFVLVFLAVLHMIYLHKDGPNNFLGLTFFAYDRPMFYPYYIVKDLFGVIGLISVFTILIFYSPNVLGHPDNYIVANPLITPTHIVPEWYSPPSYATLRPIPDKLLGVIALGSAILVLFLVPILLHSEIRSLAFKPISQFFLWVFVAFSLLLGWVGSLPVKFPFVFLGQFLTCYYSIHFLLFGPIGLWLDTWLPRS